MRGKHAVRFAWQISMIRCDCSSEIVLCSMSMPTKSTPICEKISEIDGWPIEVQAANGVVDVVARDEAEAVDVARRYLSYFSGSSGFPGPSAEWEAADQRLLRHLVPENRKTPYDVAEVVDSVVSAGQTLGGRGAAAVLRRMRLQPVGDPVTAAEVFGSYSRGDRMHAIACRVEQVMTPTGLRWQVVALHIG